MRNIAFAAAGGFLFFGVGCAGLFSNDPTAMNVSAEIARSETMAAESLTMSRLSAIERSMADYIKAKGAVPKTLDELVPEYLAEVPDVTLGIRGHRDTKEVVYYPPSAIQNNVINGTEIRDRGGWGYAFNGERVIVFVDCTHPSTKRRPWYRMTTGLRLEASR